jgi:hypothetical protein
MCDFLFSLFPLDIHQIGLLDKLLSRPILFLLLLPLRRRPFTFVPLVDHLFRDTVQLFAREDSEQGPREVERVVDASVLVDPLLDECAFKLVEEL